MAQIGEEISVSTAARLARCSPDTVLRWIEEGAIAARRTSPRGWWKIEAESLAAYLQHGNPCLGPEANRKRMRHSKIS